MEELLAVGIILLLVGVNIPSTGSIVIESKFPTGILIYGSTRGKVGELLEFLLILLDQNECEFMLYVDWDDGTNTGWKGPYFANEVVVISHTWYECGVYTFQATAECNDAYYNATFEVTIVSGDTLYVGGSGEGNYTRIQNAINDAFYGDTVFVYDDSSPYYENIDIKKKINLIGENKETTIIDGRKKDDVIKVNWANVMISGFTIQNSSSKNWWDAGIEINRDKINITGNIVFSNNIGIYAQTWHSIIFDNIISNNKGYGIIAFSTYNSSIIGNNIFLNNQGIKLDLFCTCNIIVRNNISLNNDYGINSTYDNYRNTIMGNNINSNNRYGLHLHYSDNNTITNNNISNNYLGINCGGKDNIIEKNNFIENKRHAYISGYNLLWKNTWDSNYWDNWIGLKIKLPIVQKLPKAIFGFRGIIGLIPWINLDWNPAQEPYDIEV